MRLAAVIQLYLLKKALYNVRASLSHRTVRYLPYSRSDVSREAWKIEDPELEDLDFRRQQRTVEPNGKNPSKN